MRVILRTIAVLCILVLSLEKPDSVSASIGVETRVSPEAGTFVVQPDPVMIFYDMGGGTNNRFNPWMVEREAFPIRLRIPYRRGYSFGGWYYDADYKYPARELTAGENGIIVLHAKWDASIDNVYNVEHYDYQSSRLLETNTIRLKDCEYSFCEHVNIPGMPSTKSDDFLNNYIFSASQCPQGLCLTEEFILITSYSDEDDCLGELLVFDRESGEILVTLGMDANSHLGGIAFDGKNVWVCNSYERTIERISYDFIQLMAFQNKGEVIDATELVDIYPVDNVPSCITYYGGRLWIATHTIYLESRMMAYSYDSGNNRLNTLGTYKIPSQVQGVTFDEDGMVYLSTSYGRTESSYLKVYESVVTMSSRPGRPDVQVEMPPGSEELATYENQIYVLFESAGEKYYEGTDGKGTSSCPLDKILQIEADSIQE